MIGAIFQFLGLNLKNKPNEAKLGSKITKKIFIHFDYNVPKEDLLFFLDQRLSQLFETQNFEQYSGPELQSTKFENRFSLDFAYLNLLDKTFFLLERGRNHAMACMANLLLL